MWNQRPCTHEEAKANPGMYSWCPDCGDPVEQEAQRSAAGAIAPVQGVPDAVRQERAAAHQQAVARQSASSSSQGPVDVAKLKELKELLDVGALTEEEFSEAKARVLHSAPAIAPAPSAPVTAQPFQQQPQFVPNNGCGTLYFKGCILPFIILVVLSALGHQCGGGSSSSSSSSNRNCGSYRAQSFSGPQTYYRSCSCCLDYATSTAMNECLLECDRP